MEKLSIPPAKCAGCRNGNALDFDFSMAFQPIFDIRTGMSWAYEALVRGTDNEPAGQILEQVSEENRYAFDQKCRVTAIKQAVKAGILETDARLSINFLPNAVYSPKACIKLTIDTASKYNLPVSRLLFEFTENEDVDDAGHLQNIVECYKYMGLATALDDFGAGYSNLSRLANFQTDIVKLDMCLIVTSTHPCLNA